MGDAVAVGIRQVGAGRTVIGKRLPFAGLVAIAPLQPQRLVNGDAQLAGGDSQRIALWASCQAGRLKPLRSSRARPSHGTSCCGAMLGAIQRQLATAF